MDLTAEQRRGLNIALNEATWHHITIDPDTGRTEITVKVNTLPEHGPPPGDPTITLTLQGVSRIAASLRHGYWNDTAAPVQPLGLVDLAPAVQSFGASPIYGWEFIDPPPDSWTHWEHRLSLDHTWPGKPAPHILDLFQEGDFDTGPRHLDLRVWFTTLHLTRNGDSVPLAEIIDGGIRWWHGFHHGDPRTTETAG